MERKSRFSVALANGGQINKVRLDVKGILCLEESGKVYREQCINCIVSLGLT